VEHRGLGGVPVVALMLAFLETVAALLVLVAAAYWWLLERDADRVSRGWLERHRQGKGQL